MNYGFNPDEYKDNYNGNMPMSETPKPSVKNTAGSASATSAINNKQKTIIITALSVMIVLIIGCSTVFCAQMLSDSDETDETTVSPTDAPVVAVVETEEETEEDSDEDEDEDDDDDNNSTSAKTAHKREVPQPKPKDPPTPSKPSKPTYISCGTCKYVHMSDVTCPACKSNYKTVKSEVYCPTCGGGYDVGGAVHSTYCNICKKTFKCCKTDLHCKDCGKCYSEYPQLTLKRTGYCENCYENHQQTLRCMICDTTLKGSDEVNNVCCDNCYYSLDRCEYLGYCDYEYAFICYYCDSAFYFDTLPDTPVQKCPECDEWVLCEDEYDY